MKLAALIFFLFCIITIKSISQEYNYYHYDVKDGLSGINVYCVEQDKDGFLWFGTSSGLSRFDGSNFKNFTNDDGLNENEIINLFVDSKNRVWIFPFKSSVYYYYQGKIYNEFNDTLIKKFHLKDEIFKACEDKYGNIFFLEQKRLHILSASNELTETDKIDGRLIYNNGCGISKNGSCNLSLSFPEDFLNRQINILEYKASRFINKEVFRNYSFSRNALEINPAYIIIRNGIFFEIYNQKTSEYFSAKVPHHFHTVSYINDSCFAVSTADKTFLYNINQKKTVDSFLTNKAVNKCFKDNEDNLWFATITEGLYRLSSTKFKVYRIEEKNNSMPVYALSAFKNNLYIGSANSLWSLSPDNNELKKINIKTNYINRQISVIKVFDSLNFLFGSNQGLFKVNNAQALNHLPDVAVKNFSIYNDSVVIATDRAVFNLRLPNLNYNNPIWNSRATCAEKINKQYYIGTLNSLYIVGNNFGNSAKDIGKIYPVLKDKIIAIRTVSGNDAWIATGNNGLVYMKNDKVIYHLTTNNGLTSNLCKCLYVSDNNLWVGTDKGISKINLSGFPFQIKNFTAAEGLESEIINCIYTKGDSVFAGTPFGLSFFRDSKIEQKSICVLKLLDIKSGKHNWYDKPDSIKLSSNDNFLRFEYAGISFVSAGDITYYYQLAGLDSAWQSTKQNSVEFQSLPAGEYKFNIYAVNKHGIKSNMVSVSFSRAKTFWQLTSVRLLAMIALVLSFLLIMRLRVKSIKKSANKKLIRERKIYELEQMALRAQMNPHFIFNSINSIQQYVFAGDIMEANQFITDFSSLVRQTLYISGKKFITLAEEIKYLNAYLELEKCKYENAFHYKIQVDKEVSENIPIPPLLLQPFIENSIRHGVLNIQTGQGEISIYYLIRNNCLQCIIEDNGIGRERSIKLKNNIASDHQSKGMELVQKRIKSLNSIYNIYISVVIEDIVEQNQTGTRVKIQLPLNYAD